MFSDFFILIYLEFGLFVVFGYDVVYNVCVDLFWKLLCELNGEIIDYEIEYGSVVMS